jgi:hypothetical protein
MNDIERSVKLVPDLLGKTSRHSRLCFASDPDEDPGTPTIDIDMEHWKVQVLVRSDLLYGHLRVADSPAWTINTTFTDKYSS